MQMQGKDMERLDINITESCGCKNLVSMQPGRQESIHTLQMFKTFVRRGGHFLQLISVWLGVTVESLMHNIWFIFRKKNNTHVS